MEAGGRGTTVLFLSRAALQLVTTCCVASAMLFHNDSFLDFFRNVNVTNPLMLSTVMETHTHHA